ncbi:MAG: hypothetical protein ABIG40_00705 [Parcubacteria group bacterium]
MKNRQKIYFTFGALGLFFALLIFLVVFPLFSMIKKNAGDLIDSKKETVSLASEIENLGKLTKRYQECQPDFNKIDSLFVDSEIPIDFIRFLEKLAADSGVFVKISLGSGAADSKNQEQPWPSLYFQLSSESPLLNLSRFLEKLENSPYLIEIQNLSVSKVGEQKSTKNVSANFLIKVFAK